MSQEEKIHLLAELTQEKHQHMLDLDRLKQAEENLSLANDSVENLSQQLALYSQLNTTLQENLDSLSQMLQMNEQQLVQEKMRNSASDRSQHELEELRQTLEDAQTNFKQEISKVSEEKRRIEEEYRMLEAQKVGLEHTLEVVKGELEVERLQATLAQQEAALRGT
jgi:predicted  nucleic acid-binding Zn-ribbon protein